MQTLSEFQAEFLDMMGTGAVFLGLYVWLDNLKPTTPLGKFSIQFLAICCIVLLSASLPGKGGRTPLCPPCYRTIKIPVGKFLLGVLKLTAFPTGA